MDGRFAASGQPTGPRFAPRPPVPAGHQEESDEEPDYCKCSLPYDTADRLGAIPGPLSIGIPTR